MRVVFKGSALPPASLVVAPGLLLPANCFASAPAFSGTAGVKEELTVHTADSFGNNLTVSGKSPPALVAKLSHANASSTAAAPRFKYGYVDQGDGTLGVSVYTTAAGSYRLSLTLGGKAIRGSPFAFVVGSAALNPLRTRVSGAGLAKAVAGTNTTLRITTHDSYKNRLPTGGLAADFSAAFEPAGPAVHVLDHNDGSYSLSYVATVARSFKLELRLAQTRVKTVSALLVAPAPASSATSVLERAAVGAVAGAKASFSVRLKDAYGNQVPGSSAMRSGVRVLILRNATGAAYAPKAALSAAKSGSRHDRIDAKYKATLSGSYLVSVSLGVGGWLNTSAEWSKAPPPQLKSAIVNNNGAGITVEFDRKTNRGGFTSAFRCDKLLNGTLASQLGRGSKCLFKSARRLKIIFGVLPSILPGAHMRVQIDNPKHAVTTLGLDSEPCNSFATLSKPAKATQPKILASFPLTVGTCDNVLIDCSGSTDPALGTPTYKYVMDPDSDNADAINQGLATASGDKAVINGTLLKGGQAYKFFVTLRNSYGDTATATGVFVKNDSPSPRINIAGATTRSVDYKSALRLIGMPVISPCPGASTQLAFKWSIDPASPDSFALNKQTMDTPKLYIAPNTLVPTKNYVLMLTGSDISDASVVPGVTRVALTVPSSPVSASIAGGNRKVSNGVGTDALVLDGSGSRDPDDVAQASSQFEYKWTCATELDGSSCYTEEEYGPGDQIWYTARLEVPSRHAKIANVPTLKPEALVFTLLVTKEPGPRIASATVTITLVETKVPAVSIASLASSVVQPEAKLVLRGTATSGNELKAGAVASLTYAWTEDSVGLPVILSEHCVGLGFMESMTCAMRALPLGYASPWFVSSSAVLQGGMDYAFILTASELDGLGEISTGEAESTIYVNSPPSSGTALVSPMKGEAMITLYELSFAGWIDDDVPLSYDLSQCRAANGTAAVDESAGEGAVAAGCTISEPLSGRGSSNVITFYIPTAGKVALKASVYDVYGSATPTYVVLMNLEAPYPDTKASDDLKLAVGVGDFSYMSTICTALTAEVEPAAVRRRRLAANSTNSTTCVVCETVAALHKSYLSMVLGVNDVKQFLNNLNGLTKTNTTLPIATHATMGRLYASVSQAALALSTGDATATVALSVAHNLLTISGAYYCEQNRTDVTTFLNIVREGAGHWSHALLKGATQGEAAKTSSSASVTLTVQRSAIKNAVHGSANVDVAAADMQAALTSALKVHGIRGSRRRRMGVSIGPSPAPSAYDSVYQRFTPSVLCLGAALDNSSVATWRAGVRRPSLLSTHVHLQEFRLEGSSTDMDVVNIVYNVTVSRAARTPHYFAQCVEVGLASAVTSQDIAPLTTRTDLVGTQADGSAYVQCTQASHRPNQAVAVLEVPVTPCPALHYQTHAQTATSDRVCAPLTLCVLNRTFETTKPTAKSDRGCSNLTVCGASAYQSVAPSLLRDRGCACNGGFYYNTSVPRSTAIGRRLAAYSHASGSSTGSGGSGSGRRLSSGDSSGSGSGGGDWFGRASGSSSGSGSGSWSDDDTPSCDVNTVGHTPAVTRWNTDACSVWSECANGSEFQSRAPCGVLDRVCSALRVCHNVSEYQTRAPSATSDRACQNLTLCRMDATYETTAPAAASNRVCSAVSSACDNATQFEGTAPTLKSDRVCLEQTRCGNTTEYETKAPGPASDRACGNLTFCVVVSSGHPDAHRPSCARPAILLALGSWVGVRRLSHLSLLLTASRMVLPKILVLILIRSPPRRTSRSRPPRPRAPPTARAVPSAAPARAAAAVRRPRPRSGRARRPRS